MSSAEWWESVLQGSLGSIVALLGVFLIIRSELRRDERNRKNEREREERARQEERDKDSVNRTKLNSATLHAAATETLLNNAVFNDKPHGQLVRKLIDFGVEEVVEYPDAFPWAFGHAVNIIRTVRHKESERICRAIATKISANLTIWSNEGRPKNYFAGEDPDREFEKILTRLGIDPESIPSIS